MIKPGLVSVGVGDLKLMVWKSWPVDAACFEVALVENNRNEYMPSRWSIFPSM